MELDSKEHKSGITWILTAGVLAALLGLSLFFVDTEVAQDGAARDRAHAAELRKLREAQASVGSGHIDPRESVVMQVERNQGELAAGAEGHADGHNGGHDDSHAAGEEDINAQPDYNAGH